MRFRLRSRVKTNGSSVEEAGQSGVALRLPPQSKKGDFIFRPVPQDHKHKGLNAPLGAICL
jgi:hypothetical protein